MSVSGFGQGLPRIEASYRGRGSPKILGTLHQYQGTPGTRRMWLRTPAGAIVELAETEIVAVDPA